jgi:peptide deformylase
MTKIVSAPNSVLSTKAKEFDFSKNKKTLDQLLMEMEEALLSASDPKGVGLAAPQIGKSIAVFITKPTDKAKIVAFFNPEIVEQDKLEQKDPKKKIKKLEGCLSLPNIWGEVKRSPSVTLSYQDKSGKKRTKKFTGFMATIVQHETDHLNGILFPKHVLEQKGKLYKSYKNEEGQDEFEELPI